MMCATHQSLKWPTAPVGEEYEEVGLLPLRTGGQTETDRHPVRQAAAAAAAAVPVPMP